MSEPLDLDQLNERAHSNPEAYWAEQAKRIDWQVFPKNILHAETPATPVWFGDGKTNLCHNAVDRHAQARPDAAALIYVSSETGVEQTYSFAQLQSEVVTVARMLTHLGVGKGDRVLIYMPMIPQAVFAMLACARIGAIHVVVFGGFAADSLASRIEDAQPKVILSADGGSRGGKRIPYKPLLDGALQQLADPPKQVVVYDRKLCTVPLQAGRDLDWEQLARDCGDADVPCVWLDSNAPSYVLHTSGTTGKPKGVQRDTGGYAVALAASMELVYKTQAGDVFFAASDIGWVVGHSYIVYAPLLAGAATVLYEGTPIYPDAGALWRIVEKYQVTGLFTAPTAIRILKKNDPAFLSKYKLDSLRALFLAGEPLDEATATWIREGIRRPIVDNYWQTETGSPILAVRWSEASATRGKLGSAGKAMPGFDLAIVDASTGAEVGNNQKGLLTIKGPLPPGCLATLWQSHERYLRTYWSGRGDQPLYSYSTFDWAIRDDDGDYFMLGRSDDVINVAGHRLGTREIEEALNSHPAVAESAVVGIEDELKGQAAWAFVVLRGTISAAEQGEVALIRALGGVVDARLGPVARPSRIFFVTAFPKTRSGKVVRRALQAICEKKDLGDVSTIEDAKVLSDIQAMLEAGTTS
ncbi:MAG: propionate--CoA ligase [Janthinobacterium lividum]